MVVSLSGRLTLRGRMQDARVSTRLKGANIIGFMGAGL